MLIKLCKASVAVNRFINSRKLRETTMYRVGKFARTIGVVDRLGIERIKRVVCKEGLSGRTQRTKTTKMLVYS